MKTVLLKDLKKGDTFYFNECKYIVKRRYISDEKPLIAYGDERFYHDELEVMLNETQNNAI